MGGASSKLSQLTTPESIIKKTKKNKMEAVEDVQSSLVKIHEDLSLGEAWPQSVPRLPKEIEKLISDYHNNDYDVSRYTLKQCNDFMLFSKNATSTFHAFEMGTHILYARIEKVFALAKLNSNNITSMTFTCCDPFQRKANGTPLQLAAAAGDYLLVEKLRNLLPSKEIANAQLCAQFPAGWKEETQNRMKKLYLEPLEQFIQQLIEIKLSQDAKTFYQAKTECHDLIIKFRTDIRQKATHPIVKTGLIFDPMIYRLAYEAIRMNIKKLGGWNSIKTHLIFACGYQSLLGASSAKIAQIILNGVRNRNLEEKTELCKNLMFIDESPFFASVSEGVGITCYVNPWGTKFDSAQDCWRSMQGWKEVVNDITSWDSHVNTIYQYCDSYASLEARAPSLQIR